MEKKCILIYDDDVEILNVCKAILQSSNYRVETIQTCENIISDVLRVQPGIVLMDLWIPSIGGENAVRYMHENPETKDIPVVLFSASDDIEKISERVQADSFLRKPFDIQTFKDTIKEYIL
jgi:two-component system cell cycle response regulator DivK